MFMRFAYDNSVLKANLRKLKAQGKSQNRIFGVGKSQNRIFGVGKSQNKIFGVGKSHTH
jgi:hypothetical protein